MKRWRTALVLALLPLSLFAQGQRLVRSVREAAAAPDEDYIRRVPFALNGKIAAKDTLNTTLFRDKTGSATVIFLPIDDYPCVGSVISAEGELRMSEFGDRKLYATSYKVLRTESPDPPVEMSLPQLLRDSHTPNYVTTWGTIVEASPDEVDADYSQVLLFSEGKTVNLAMHSRDYTYEAVAKLVNAEVRITGIYDDIRHWRQFTPPYFTSLAKVEILKPAPADPFDIADLDWRTPSHDPSHMRGTRKRTHGTVLARWQGNNVLVGLGGKRFVQASCAHGTTPPQIGQTVEIAGLVDTDGSNLFMRDAIWRPADLPAIPLQAPVQTEAKALFLNAKGKRAIQYAFNGRYIRLEGEVLTIQSSDNIGSQLLIDSNNFTIPVDVSGCPDAVRGVEVGCRIAVSGICLVDFDNWRQGAPFPHIRGFRLVVRDNGDISILSHPSPFTPRLLFAVILVLFLGLVAFFAWNRILRRLIDRKGRELFKSQIAKAESELRIDERTRLAAELHDDTVQSLTAVAYRVSEALNALDGSAEASRECLLVAARMLKSCRTNLRRCLWDLRSDVLDEPDFARAILKTVENVAGDARVGVRFAGRRALISDTTAHTVLNVLRELVANAVNHGNAGHIGIAGECRRGIIRFSVRDNGTGFDPLRRPGQDDGHFGLDGIQERLAHVGGILTISSSAGKGTYARISIASPDQQNGIAQP